MGYIPGGLISLIGEDFNSSQVDPTSGDVLITNAGGGTEIHYYNHSTGTWDYASTIIGSGYTSLGMDSDGDAILARGTGPYVYKSHYVSGTWNHPPEGSKVQLNPYIGTGDTVDGVSTAMENDKWVITWRTTCSSSHIMTADNF